MTLPGRADQGEIDRLAQVASWLDDAMVAGRSLISQVVPLDLDSSTWQQASIDRIDRQFPDSSAKLIWDLDELSLQIDGPLATAAMRITVEACRNAIRHGNAKQIKIYSSSTNAGFELKVSDDGSGFDPENLASRSHGRAQFGLRAMQARAKRIGGELEISSSLTGTTICLTAPPHQRAGANH